MKSITKLSAKWSKRKKDILYNYPASKADAHLLNNFLYTKHPNLFNKFSLNPSFMEELDARGYDLTTFKFQISLKNE